MIPITVTNYVHMNLLHTHSTICYHWYEALPITIMIVAILYPIIPFAKRYVQILLGKKASSTEA